MIAKELFLAQKSQELDVRAEQLEVTEESAALNYQRFRQQLEAEWDRAKRYNRRLSLLLLDVDDLHIYQEKVGEENKDRLVMEVSQMVRTLCRKPDIVAQYVSDELAVILPETDASGAFVVAERIRESISRCEFVDQEGARNAKLTASLGVANYPLNTADLEGLTRQVESALYKAKVTGRNRVCGPELPA